MMIYRSCDIYIDYIIFSYIILIIYIRFTKCILPDSNVLLNNKMADCKLPLNINCPHISSGKLMHAYSIQASLLLHLNEMYLSYIAAVRNVIPCDIDGLLTVIVYKVYKVYKVYRYTRYTRYTIVSYRTYLIIKI